MKHIHKCEKCKEYTMEEICPRCKIKTFLPKPAKYSPEDRVGKYRVIAKLDKLKKEGFFDND